ncbi:MAG: hypothetical protein NVSMB46_04210 [Candidatus Saccharimonadales bacterium]
MNTYKAFIFEDYIFNKNTKTLELNYSCDGEITFKEIYTFNFDYVDYIEELLVSALQNLFFMSGVSYYKAYIPETITIHQGKMDDKRAQFFSETYQKGLGEFYYTNNMDPKNETKFPVNIDTVQRINTNENNHSVLIGIGGGKDSLVSVEALRTLPKVATWSLSHKEQLTPLIEQVGVPHFWIERTIDPKIIELNNNGALNGHIPISAVLACVGTIVSILAGYDNSVVSNENSSNEPTLLYKDMQINHQYSKSLEFETSYQHLLRHCFGNQLSYFSFLRPLSELYIAQIFSEKVFDKYKNTFSSCNRAFTHSSNAMFWCGNCSKCAFVFMILSPFISRENMELLFSGKNLLLDQNLEKTYRNLLGIEGEKPLECIGTIQESRTAMTMCKKIYSELNKYEYENDDSYDYQKLQPHSMTEQFYDHLVAFIG